MVSEAKINLPLLASIDKGVPGISSNLLIRFTWSIILEDASIGSACGRVDVNLGIEGLVFANRLKDCRNMITDESKKIYWKWNNLA